MNLNDPRLELIHRSQMGGLSIEELAQLERNLHEDSGFRELYVRYLNLDLALSAIARSSPLPVAPPVRSLSARCRWVFRGASKDFVPTGLSARERLPWPGFRFGVAVLAVALLAFLVPLPQVAVDPCERLFQQASAEVSYWALQLTGIPVSRNGVFFELPGMTIEFVVQCNGARSTFVLLTVGVVLARLVLNKTLNRAILVLAIIPIGIVQKGFWNYLLTSLAVRLKPDIFNTWVHYRGELICFALSLILLMGLLWLLHRSERSQGEKPTHSCPC